MPTRPQDGLSLGYFPNPYSYCQLLTGWEPQKGGGLGSIDSDLHFCLTISDFVILSQFPSLSEP